MKMMIMVYVTALLMLGCSDESEPSIDVKKISGIWVPYELRYNDGTIDYGPFTAKSIFGVYAESIQLNDDKTFIPVIWTDKDNYDLKTDETGNFEYVSKGNRLFFTEGAWDMEFEITGYSNEELWLTYTGDVPLHGAQYRLKREIGE